MRWLTSMNKKRHQREINRLVREANIYKWENPLEAGDCAEWDKVYQISSDEDNITTCIEL